MGESFRIRARVLLYAPSNRQDNTYHSLCYSSRSNGWNEKYLNGSTIKDRSEDPSHYERMLLPWSNISLLINKEENTRCVCVCVCVCIPVVVRVELIKKWK